MPMLEKQQGRSDQLISGDPQMSPYGSVPARSFHMPNHSAAERMGTKGRRKRKSQYLRLAEYTVSREAISSSESLNSAGEIFTKAAVYDGPSYLTMMSQHLVWSLGTAQFQLRRAKSNKCQLVWALIEDWARGVPLFNQFFTSVPLKAFTAFINSCSPSRSVLGCVFEVINIYAAWVEILLKGVSEAFRWTAPPVLSKFQLSIQDFLQESIITHSDCRTCSSKMSFENHSLNTVCFCSFKDVNVGHFVLPVDLQNRPKTVHVKFFKLLDVPAVNCPHFTPV